MSEYYDFKILIPKKLFADGNFTSAWRQICAKLDKSGKDFHTVSMHPRMPEKWFHASSDGSRILIQKAKDPSKNSKVTMKYWIRFDEFVILAELYNDYVNSVSNNIRYTDSHMSSYVITLIAELLRE